LLVSRGYLREELRDMPARMYFHVEIDVVIEALEQVAENPPTDGCRSRRKSTSQYGVNVQTSLAESAKQDCTKAPNKENCLSVCPEAPNMYGGNEQTSLAESAKHSYWTETTAETTAFFTPDGALMAGWMAIKEELKTHVSEREWKLWVRPARLLRPMGNCLLVALPPSNAIMAASMARKPLLQEIARRTGYGGVMLTVYPDEYQQEQLKQRYPEIHERTVRRKAPA
jgi:hypothetical protein